MAEESLMGESSGEAEPTAVSGNPAPESGAPESNGAPAEGYWPADWRDKMAGGDEKERTRLDRMASPEAVFKANREIEAKMSNINAAPVLPEGATDEEVAKYKADLGLPAEPNGYLDALGEGLVIGEADQPRVDAFLASAHETNMSQDNVNAALQWYYSEQETAISEAKEADANLRAETTVALREEWGGEYTGNINAVSNYLDALPDGMGNLIRDGALADGSRMGNHAGMMKLIVDLARGANPFNTVVPAGVGDPAASVADEISAIQTLMRTDRKAYDADPGKQERYRKLLGAQMANK